MIHLSLRMVVPHAKSAEVTEFLTDFVRRTRLEAGCIESGVYSDLEQKRGVLVEEFWTDQDQLERHLRSPEFHKIILVLELSVTPPKVSVRTVTHSSGLEAIQEARSVENIDP